MGTSTRSPGVSGDRAPLPALSYAVAYPAGVGGVIASLVVLRWFFRIDPERDGEAFKAEVRLAPGVASGRPARGSAMESRTTLLLEQR